MINSETSSAVGPGLSGMPGIMPQVPFLPHVPELLISCLTGISFTRHVIETLLGSLRHSDLTPLV